MSYLNIEIRVSDAARRRYESAWKQDAVRRRVSAGAARAIRGMKDVLLPRLRKAAPERQGGRIAWTSEKQRIAVVAFMRSKGWDGYERTGRMVAGWEVRYMPSDRRGELGAIFATNQVYGERAWPPGSVRYWQYVVGRANDSGYQQGFHAAQGWYTLADEIRDVRPILNRSVGQAVAIAIARSV